jgi:hypothetical protein
VDYAEDVDRRPIDFWPVHTMYAVQPRGYARGITNLFITGHEGWISIRPSRRGGTCTIRHCLPSGKVTFTAVAGPPSVVRSLAETMLTAAANAAGIEVIR